MWERLNHRAGHYLLLLTVCACLFLLNLGGPSLWDLDEGRNGTAAMEMYESGDWIVPKFNGKLRSHKPALLYWLQATAYGVFGAINEFAARLPSALAAMLSVLTAYELGRQLFNPGTGLLGGLVLASSTLFCASAHFANSDALLLTFTTATLLLVWIGATQHRRVVLAAAGVTIGLAVLAKGPVGVVLPAAVTFAFLIGTGRWRLLFDPVWWVTGFVCALVALPWYVLVTIDTRMEFLHEFFGTHNLERALTPMEAHGGPPWYYLAVVMIGLVPWSAFLGGAVWYGAWSTVRKPWCRVRAMWSGARDDEAEQSVDAYRFLACWIMVYLLAFTLAATKLPNYILPAMPPLALLIARVLDRWRRGVLQLPAWILPAGLATLVLVGGVTIFGLLLAGGVVEWKALRGRSWPGLEAWALLGTVPIAGAAAGAWCLWRRQRTGFVLVTVATALAFVIPLAAGGTSALNPYRAPRPLVAQSGALQRDQDIRVACYQLEFLPSLNFYVQRNVQYCDDPRQAAEFLAQPLQAYLFLPRAEWEKLTAEGLLHHRVVASHREMYRAGEVVVVTNR
jgi:4-amino-4-deoxy-L-arabinose transferase-like glycosyltransferase